MSSAEVVESYLRGEISRRALVRRLAAAGVSLSAAVAYSELLRPEWALAAHQCTDEFYDHYGFYGDCGDHYGGNTPPPNQTPTGGQDKPPDGEKQPDPPPQDTTAPGTRMKVSKLSLATLLVTNRLVVRFTTNEAGSATFTATTAAAGRSGSAEAARRIVVARGSARFKAAGTKRVRLKLTRKGRKALLRRRRATLRITSRAVDAAGNARVRAVTVKLR
jgi:hypothetical protein